MIQQGIVRTPIIPVEQQFYGTKDEFDHQSIAFFLAAGFFPSDATYFKDLKVLRPGSTYSFKEDGTIDNISTDFSWHYTPRSITLTEATNRFAELFEKLVKEKTAGKNLILPLSGGLDSRSLATALLQINKKASCYSYSFEKGFNENKFGKLIAEKAEFPFRSLTIPNGYLWEKRSEIAHLNGCYSEFTHARQMAVIDEVSKFGDTFLLGHWGDVLFDGSGIGQNISDDELISITKKKIIKEGGKELAEMYWQHWGLNGTFAEFLDKKVEEMYLPVKIQHAGAKLRAFKSMYWAPRWTSVNLGIFSSSSHIYLPYYEDEICKFICTIPEELLSDRQIQIEYIKSRRPDLANIPWQGYEPCNLNNYKNFHKPRYYPFRLIRKLKDNLRKDQVIKRNWEIQFVGKDNRSTLLSILEENSDKELLPKPIIEKITTGFYGSNSKYYSHPLSMLVTLASFNEMNTES